ncbi:S4 domain-containing protein YaaA [Tissierella creatinophila]|uniref:Ribosome-associated protein n=1 Tax=Tissierella creatinophila DSM 6911 TaxID=1123403 RepID=A0A1U7M607_TISCR|nr:S4 domain-containing protein YaaA [Tissierella creatinophila]OLS02721.1 ribosome-associated protein [Tissierella creatinophila DSM 6911]
MKEIKIDTEFIKLDQFLKLAGIAGTGGHAKILISEGEVLVNGQSCTMRGKKLRKDDLVKIDGKSFKIIQD